MDRKEGGNGEGGISMLESLGGHRLYLSIYNRNVCSAHFFLRGGLLREREDGQEGVGSNGEG